MLTALFSFSTERFPNRGRIVTLAILVFIALC